MKPTDEFVASMFRVWEILEENHLSICAYVWSYVLSYAVTESFPKLQLQTKEIFARKSFKNVDRTKNCRMVAILLYLYVYAPNF